MTSTKDLLSELSAARAEAKLRLHLLSMDARERWEDLETKLDALERKIQESGERTTEAAVSGVRGLTQAVGAFFATHVPGKELNERASTIMTAPVRSCSPTDTLNSAARILWEANCGAVPVLEGERLIGMITDRDVCMACYTQGRNPSEATVGSCMSKGVVTCLPDASVAEVLEAMSKHRVRRIPIVSREGGLVGIVSLADVARWTLTLKTGQAAAREALSATLAAVCEPANTSTPGHAAAAE